MHRQHADALIRAKRQILETPYHAQIRNIQIIGKLNAWALARLLLLPIISCVRNHLRRNRWNVLSVKEQ